MSRIWFSGDLETVALFWRIHRRDGITLGFATHDRDLWFDDVLHRAAPGMVPAAIRRSANLDPDSAEVEGALSHAALSASDLAAGRFDRARVTIGMVDWQGLETEVLFTGSIGTVDEDAGKFSAALVSRKSELQRDPIPRTSPTCRAVFCGPGCNLSPARFELSATATSVDPGSNTVAIDSTIDANLLIGGDLRWLDGPGAGLRSAISGISAGRLVLAQPLEWGGAGYQVELRHGCDRTIATCSSRFDNAVNFRGEPHLPGNDMLARYPAAS